MARIVSIGSALQDVYLIDHDDFGTNRRGFFNQLELGAKVDIDQIKFSTGGGATNAATTFARNGHESIFMGTIAHDPAGAAIIDTLDREGIDTSYISYSTSMQTGYSVLLLSPTGERTILTCRGASSHFELLNPADLLSIYPDWLYVSTLHGNMELLDQLFTEAKNLGAKIMFNPGNHELSHPRKLLGLLSDVDVLLINQEEAKKIAQGNSLSELISRLGNYTETTIITAGNQGAIAKSGDTTYRLGLYADPPVKDSTGAGDAFGSGFLAAFARGDSFRDSLIFASANSTSVIQQIGSKDGILSSPVKLRDMPITELR